MIHEKVQIKKHIETFYRRRHGTVCSTDYGSRRERKVRNVLGGSPLEHIEVRVCHTSLSPRLAETLSEHCSVNTHRESTDVRRKLVLGSHLQTGETLAAALLDRANFTGLVLGCIEAKFCK